MIHLFDSIMLVILGISLIVLSIYIKEFVVFAIGSYFVGYGLFRKR